MHNDTNSIWWRIASLFTPGSPWKKVAGAAAIGWTALLFYACFVPSDDVPRLRFPYADKWVHVALFIGFTVLWAFTFPGGWKRLTLIAAIAVLIGWLIEVAQGALPALGRSYDGYDLMADTAGAIVGVVAWGFIGRHIPRQFRKRN